tara:strand:+ start:749 stop:1477 length:729 start_codon:yes stop_codon:yes gene_type:complete
MNLEDGFLVLLVFVVVLFVWNMNKGLIEGEKLKDIKCSLKINPIGEPCKRNMTNCPGMLVDVHTLKKGAGKKDIEKSICDKYVSDDGGLVARARKGDYIMIDGKFYSLNSTSEDRCDSVKTPDKIITRCNDFRATEHGGKQDTRLRKVQPGEKITPYISGNAKNPNLPGHNHCGLTDKGVSFVGQEYKVCGYGWTGINKLEDIDYNNESNNKNYICPTGYCIEANTPQKDTAQICAKPEKLN